MTISDAVRKNIQKYPFLKEYLAMGIINYRALARHLTAELKKDLGSEPNPQSVATALRRLSKTKKAPFRTKEVGILSQSNLSISYDLGVVTVEIGPGVLKRIPAIGPAVEGEAYMLLLGKENLTIVTHQKGVPALLSLFRDRKPSHKTSLAGIIVKSSTDIAETPGVISHLTSILALEKINIVEMMSSFTETFFIVEEKDTLRAVEAIRREILRARGGE